MSEEKIPTSKIANLGALTASEQELNRLFKEILDGVRDDIIESQQNVEMYFEAITNETGGKELYGTLYNEALKIKGSSRDRQLKFLNMFKDRVSVKEKLALVDQAKKDIEAGTFSHSEMNKFIEDFEAQQKFQQSPEVGAAEDYLDFEEDEEDPT